MREVAGRAPLLVASFTEVFEEFDPASVDHLFIEWTPVSKSAPTVLRGYSLRRREYYRMDSEREPGTSSWVWPASLLRNLNISKSFLGVVAWNMVEKDGTARQIYLPLRIGAAPSKKRPGKYELILVPGAELTAVYLSVALMDDGGKPVRYLTKSRELNHGYYPPFRGIRIPVSDLPQSGIYRIKADAKQRDKGTSNAEAWFYHAR